MNNKNYIMKKSTLFLLGFILVLILSTAFKNINENEV